MDISEIVALGSRWIHVLCAVLLAGGTFFLRLAVVPTSKDTGMDESVRESIRRRWSRVVMFSVLFLLLSGFYNMTLKILAYQLDGLYLGLLAVKFILAFVVFFLVSVLSGRSKLAVRFRESELRWYNITSLCMLAIILMAGAMKMSPQDLKTAPSEENAGANLHENGDVDAVMNDRGMIQDRVSSF